MIRLVLPLPPKGCNPNARGHWAKKARAVKGYRRTADLTARSLVRASERPRWECAELRSTWYLPDRRRRDPDNLIASMKAGIDGLRDADILADDRGLVIWPPVLRVDPERPRVEIEITEV